MLWEEELSSDCYSSELPELPGIEVNGVTDIGLLVDMLLGLEIAARFNVLGPPVDTLDPIKI